METDCTGREPDNSDDLARYFARAAQARTPLAATFELTRRCNFRCVHCYLGDQQAIRQHRHQELDTDSVIRLLDEMVEAGTLFLTLTGGDPMLRPDFVRIYAHAVRIGLLVSVYCNGSLITEEITEVFVQYPPRIAEITLYGATRKTFETITQRRGSYADCMKGIALLHRAKVRLRLKSMAMTLNYEELPAMRKIAGDLGLSFRHDCSVIPALPHEDNGSRINIRDTGKNGLRETLGFRLEPEQAAAVDFGAAEVKKKLQELTAEKGAAAEPSTKLYQCGAGQASYHITSYGRMQPCLITLRPSVDLVAGEQRIADGWNTLCAQVEEQTVTTDFPCIECKDSKLCTGCPSRFFRETGSPEEPPSFYCHYAACRRRGSSKETGLQ
ncbi:MAG: radical SAM protein [Candidatus Electrothrix sp. YB6]